MVVTVRSLGLSGISGYEVSAECFLSGGLPAFDVVGLPDAAVREARERVRAAVKNCGAKFPVSRITVNLAPAGQKKAGTVYDLPIFVGILAANGDLPKLPPDAAFIGELSLTGALRGVSGVLPMAMAAKQAGISQLFVPAENAAEATLADGLTVYGVPDVNALVAHLRGEGVGFFGKAAVGVLYVKLIAVELFRRRDGFGEKADDAKYDAHQTYCGANGVIDQHSRIFDFFGFHAIFS